MIRTVSLLLALAASPALATPEIKGSPSELRAYLAPADQTVSISDTVKETAYSDTAILSLVVSTEEDSLAFAIAANEQLRSSISQRLLEAGVGSDKIKSSKFSMSPQYGWFSSKPSSYEVINRVSVKITDERLLKTVAQLADENELVQLTDTAFEHSKKDELEIDLKNRVLDKVLKQKELYENKLGVELVPISFREPQVGRSGTSGARVLEEIVVTASRVGKSDDNALYFSASQETTSSFDEVQYEAMLTVTFKVVGTGLQR